MQTMIARKETVKDALEAARAAHRPEGCGIEWNKEQDNIIAKLLRVLEERNETESPRLWSN